MRTEPPACPVPSRPVPFFSPTTEREFLDAVRHTARVTETWDVTTIRASSGLSAPDGSTTASNLALLTASYLVWNLMLTAFNVATISLDAVSPPYARYKLHFALLNWVTNLVVLAYFCTQKTGVAAVSPRMCMTLHSASCDTTFSLQIQALYVLSLFSLKYCLYLVRSPSALLVLRAPIHLSAYRKAAVELS